MYAIDTFDTDALVACREALHGLATGATSMEQIATRVTRHLYDGFRTADDERACALVRIYKTHRFSLLPPDLQDFVRTGGATHGNPSCLTLLGTAGLEDAWNERRRSTSHQAIPLVGDLSEAPMIAALIRDLGIEKDLVLNPPTRVRTDTHLRQYNVFYVPEAASSEAVPAQEDFVLRYGVRSVVGFGGVLASGDTYAVIMFTMAPVPERAIASFRTLSLTIKSLIVPHTFSVFDPVS